MAFLHFDLLVFFDKFIPCSPVLFCLMTVVMLMLHVSPSHQLHLVVTMGIDLVGIVITIGDVREHGFTEADDLYIR